MREYETALEQRVELDSRIARLAQAIGHLTRLCGLEPTIPWGLTDACRMVLKAAGHPLTAVEVRAQLEALGFDLTRYTNDLAAIHTILKRLTGSGEARFVARAWDKPGYEWQTPARSLTIVTEAPRTKHKRAGARKRAGGGDD